MGRPTKTAPAKMTRADKVQARHEACLEINPFLAGKRLASRQRWAAMPLEDRREVHRRVVENDEARRQSLIKAPTRNMRALQRAIAEMA